ncbi:16S rRNA methyltransferase [Candidatus Bathyarchaeota archaeon]|nr:16S rRNA methyltransferase [Candidatus Bathyarchaeota archaeon]
MLTIILAESSLELMPEELVDHPVVRRDATRRRKRPEQLLLDRSYHHAAMNRLINSEKRGRPDITHITLLTSLGSPLNLMGALRLYIHTLRDWVIDISPKARIPRNSERFKGLMEQLFEVGRVPPEGNPLLRAQKMTLRELKRHINPTYTVGLTVKGRDRRTAELASSLVRQKIPAVIIGGFPRGHFTEATEQLADELVSIYPRGLEAWAVASELISAYGTAVQGAGESAS